MYFFSCIFFSVIFSSYYFLKQRVTISAIWKGISFLVVLYLPKTILINHQNQTVASRNGPWAAQKSIYSESDSLLRRVCLIFLPLEKMSVTSLIIIIQCFRYNIAKILQNHFQNKSNIDNIWAKKPINVLMFNRLQSAEINFESQCETICKVPCKSK